jgi:hypothetical protein
MRIGGVDPKTLPTEEILILPRGDQQIVFRAIGLPDMEEFQKLCPEPTPPGKLTKDGWVPNPDDENYKSVLASYHKRRLAYLVINSLEPSQVEWETVDPSNPSTWANWEQDMRNGGLSQVEINRVIQLALEANCLDESKLKKAREVFLRGQQLAAPASSGPSTELPSTQSGAPVSD